MSEAEPGPDAAATAETPSPEVLQRAFKTFKKRLKLTQLDAESSVGVGPMSGGRPSGIVAITPPNQYPRAVWEALVVQGRLKKASPGQYELA
ncbi:MAG: hypothetical protein H0T51_04040 [Pirellulales bacterium]|nr:hypothetical protein [Pirellulales bacterium]